MNFTYYKFLFITTIKKRPIWITWLLYLLTCIAFLIILPAVARMNTLQVWANTTMAVCQTFLGMTVALFTAVLGIHIFKDGLEEGTELIIISKPLSRFKVTFTKFMIFATFCLMVNVSSLIITAFTVFLPTTEIKFYWGLIVSMFIGNLVAFGVFGSIAILLTIKFAKIGVIITNIIISLIFLIYQCLTLFVFSIPIKSLNEHGMTAPSYIVTERDTTTGEYKEEEVVCFNTDAAKQFTEVKREDWNLSTNWKQMADYWKGVICRNDPTPILNVTDLAGQISLTYLSVGIDDYAFRQGHRMFAISRFYTYDLISPMSPEIINGVENKKTLPWMYTNDYCEEYDEGSIDIKFWHPQSYGFSGIAPLGTTRLRGYEDKIPVGFYVKSGEILSSKDVYFEPAEWKKYNKPFELIADRLFNIDNYDIDKTNVKPWQWSTAWCSSNAALTRYYELLWSCFTGHSGEAKYFNDPFLSDYPKSYFEINSVNDLNERFLQFKYYIYYRALKEQTELLNSLPETAEEKQAKVNVGSSSETALYENLLGIKHSTNNWFMQSNKDAIRPEGLEWLPTYVEENTQALDSQLMHDTLDELIAIVDDEVSKGTITRDQGNEIVSKSSLSKFKRTTSMFNYVAKVNEEYLFNSVDQPTRSAQYHGKAYMVSDDWYSYWTTWTNSQVLEDSTTGGVIRIGAPVGQNMQWFFYTSRATVNYWIYAVIWGTISLCAFAGGVLLYNKYDVK